MKRDKKGIVRLQLNNKDLFQFGPLDQGWWPDGLYTAPTDEALCYDIKKTKDLGFNMIRKHVKVEPARWYTYCDQMGVIVWQDMPNGDKTLEWQRKKYFDGTELARSPESEATYRKEWKEIIDYLYSYPCIGTWVPLMRLGGNLRQVRLQNGPNNMTLHVWSIRQVVEIIILAVICLICIIIRGRKCICMMHNVLRY